MFMKPLLQFILLFSVVAAYVLGLASEAEQKEFDSLCKQYPELIKAKRSFELALEDQLMKEAVPVPDGMIKKVLGSLKKPDAKNIYTPERESKPRFRKMNAWKMIAAACILLLTGSIYFGYFFSKKYQKLQEENAELKHSINRSTHTNPFLALDPIVQKPSVKWLAMMEPKDPSHCLAHIYWDSVSAKTFLLVGNIPQPVSDKHFQLWALLSNHPINLGMFDIKKQGKLIRMKNVQRADMFIITIEQKGGSPAPSMQTMYAVGKL
jgi:anti-sigma-K factor RskA